MDRYRANSNPNVKNPSTTSTAPGFDSLYASLFGSGDRQNFNTNQPAPPSANESLYPSSPYQPHQMPSNPQMHSRNVGQTPNGIPYGAHPSAKWRPPPSRPSPSSPQHQEEPYSIGPFSSIWSMKSNEAGASAGVQHQQQKNWSSDTSAAPGYRDSHPAVSATSGIPFGGYEQRAYGGNDAGFHGDPGGVTSPGYAWSTYDGVNDGNVQGLPDWRWNQRGYSPSMQSEHWQSSTHGADGNMENHAVNEWELHDEERARKNREEDMKGRQERREWKKKGINHPEFIPDHGFQKQKSHLSPQPKTSPNDKVVASFLEKYRSDDPVAFTPGSSMDSDEQIIVSTKVEVRESQCPSNEELGTSSAEKGSDTNASVTVQATDEECHISGKSPSLDRERCHLTEEHEETISNVDSSDIVDPMKGREVRSLSDPVTVQEVQQNNNVKSGTAPRKALSNGKIRPGKRKPKLPRDKRKNMVAQAEKSEIKSCEKQTVQIETKGQPENIEKNINLGSKETSKNLKPSSKPVNNISSEPTVQSSRSTCTPISKSIPENTSKGKKASSKASCKNVSSKHHGSDNNTSFAESSICGDCSSTTPCDSKTDASSRIDIPTVSVKENIGIRKDNKSSHLPSEKSSQKIDKNQSKSLEKNHVSKPSEKNEKSSSCVNDLSTADKGDSGGHKTPKENRMTNVRKHDIQTVHQKDNSDASRYVRNTVSSKSLANVGKNDIGKSSIPMQNPIPSCELKSNSTQKNERLTDEAKPVNGNKLPTTTTGSSNNVNDKTTSGLKQEQEKKKTKDSGLFFDPKRIFGGQKTVRSATPKLSKELDKSTTPPAERIPKNSNLTDFQSFQAKGNVNVPATKAEHSSALPDPPLVQGPANPTKPVRSGPKEGEMNGMLPSRKLPPSAAQTVPSSSAKDALASKAPTMKADPVSSQQHSSDPTSPAEPRPARMYSYKKDDKTGVLRRSSDPKVEEATKQQSSRRGSGGTQSSSDEAKGERRCSGDSHMYGFHHPFGCSANCYRRSSSPSSSRSNSNSRQPSSGGNQGTGSSASSEKKENPKPAGQKAQHTFPQPENSSPVFEANAFAELREGLKSSWLSKEKRKDDQKQRQEKIQKEHLEKVQQQERLDQRIKREKLEQERREQKRQQEEEEQKRQQEKLEQKRQQAKRQESASQHAKRPTRATYSQPKDPKPATSEPKDKRPGTSQTRPGQGTSTEQPRRFCPCHTEASAQTASQEDSAEESDMEEDLNRGLADEWWFKLGKKFTRGVCWLVLFSILLCLVLLSFLLALARDTCKFAYHRGWDLWTWYNEKPPHPQDDDFFSSHRSHHTGFQGSHQNNQNDTDGSGGGWFSGSGRNQQGETGGGSWSHTGGAGTHHQETGARAKQPRKKQTQNIELPSTELAAIRRLLSCDPGNYYQVVGVAEDATEDDIKKFYRKQCMLVHPDKTDQPQANEAFQVLQKAYAILIDPAKRREYQFELDYKEQLEDKVNDFYKKMAEMADSMPCGVCMKSHKRYETDLPTHAARYCATHDTRHPVKDGALWKETANLGFKIYVFLCDEHTVYDVTEWAACQNLEWLEPNTCRLLCKVKRGGRTGQQRRQQHQAGYEEMFDNIFGPGAFRQFQSSANQQGHNGNHHHGSGSSHSHSQQGGSGSSHSHSQQGGGGSRNKGVKKSRKKKK